jgi:hypothetical protein
MKTIKLKEIIREEIQKIKQPKMSTRLKELINKGWVLTEDEYGDQRVKNPETGREIKVKTALSYEPSHPAHQKAKTMVDKEIPSEYKEIPPYNPEELQKIVAKRIKDNEYDNERDEYYASSGYGSSNQIRPTDPERVAKEVESERKAENERRRMEREKYELEKQRKEKEREERERKEREERERIKNQDLPPSMWDLIDQGHYG